MIKRIGHFINIILLSLAVLTIGSCDRHGTAWNEMDKAENLMDAKPDSALVVLENIPASSVKGKKAAARYALLKSIALDKNYIDTTNFDVLQPAIDYYIKNGKPDEKLRTYYYQGRIYQNQGDDDSAMQSFMNACDLRKQVTDSLLLSHTLVAQGTLYFKQYKINDFVHYNMEAAKLYKAIGKDILAIKSYTNALDGYVMQNNKPAADSLMSICVPMVKKNPEGEAFLFPSLLSYTVNFCSSDEINLKSATKPFNVLLACTRPLITELSYKLRQKCQLLPTTPPYPIMRLETIRSIIPISCRRHPKSVWNTSA